VINLQPAAEPILGRMRIGHPTADLSESRPLRASFRLQETLSHGGAEPLRL